MYVHEALAEESPLNPRYWNTPKRKAILVGGGVAAVGAVAFLLTRSASAKVDTKPDLVGSGVCTQWDYIDPNALGGTGRYRVEMMLPPSAEFVIKDTDQLAKIFDKLNRLPGLKIEGAWVNMLAYPRTKTMPKEWPTGLDTYGESQRLRVQYVSAYENLGDIVATILSEDAEGPVAVLHAWKCMTSPAIEAQSLPTRGFTAEDADGGVTFYPMRRYAIVMRALPNVNIQTMAAQLASRGFLVSRSVVQEGTWGFDVYYRGAQPQKWAKGSVPSDTIIQEIRIAVPE